MESLALTPIVFPALDPDTGWEENLQRILDYEYLLKENLDWQLRNLSSENFNETDWSNVIAEAIGLQAGTEDLGAALKMWTEDQIAHLSLAAVAGENGAQLQLMAGGEEVGAGVQISVSNSQGSSTLTVSQDSVQIASQQITLGGGVVFASGSGNTKSISQTVISGGSITTEQIQALDIVANNIKANASISAPTITGGVINGSTIYANRIYANYGDNSNYFTVNANGWQVVSGGHTRAGLWQDFGTIYLELGNSVPGYVRKSYDESTGKHYLWIGDWAGNCGLRLNLTDGTYQLVGTPA